MIFCENVPQCLCGHVFSYWKDQIKASALDSNRFVLNCPDCKRELRVFMKQKLEFEVLNSKEEYENRAVIDKEVTRWTYVGERVDGSHYIASIFDSEESVKSFLESTKHVPVAIASFQITYKSIDKDRYLKEKILVKS